MIFNDLFNDSDIIVSKIYYKAERSWGCALVKRLTNSFATSSDLLVRCK